MDSYDMDYAQSNTSNSAFRQALGNLGRNYFTLSSSPNGSGDPSQYQDALQYANTLQQNQNTLNNAIGPANTPQNTQSSPNTYGLSAADTFNNGSNIYSPPGLNSGTGQSGSSSTVNDTFLGAPGSSLFSSGQSGSTGSSGAGSTTTNTGSTGTGGTNTGGATGTGTGTGNNSGNPGTATAAGTGNNAWQGGDGFGATVVNNSLTTAAQNLANNPNAGIANDPYGPPGSTGAPYGNSNSGGGSNSAGSGGPSIGNAGVGGLNNTGTLGLGTGLTDLPSGNDNSGTIDLSGGIGINPGDALGTNPDTGGWQNVNPYTMQPIGATSTNTSGNNPSYWTGNPADNVGPIQNSNPIDSSGGENPYWPYANQAEADAAYNGTAAGP